MGVVIDLLYKPLVTLVTNRSPHHGGLTQCYWYSGPAIGPITNECWAVLLLLSASVGLWNSCLIIVIGPCVGGMWCKTWPELRLTLNTSTGATRKHFPLTRCRVSWRLCSLATRLSQGLIPASHQCNWQWQGVISQDIQFL